MLGITVAAAALSACSSIVPNELGQQALAQTNQADRQAAQQDVEPIQGALTLDEAMARALKYNLERRTRLMEEALALNQLDVGKLDMLPKLMAQAGYTDRNRERATYSMPYTPQYGPKATNSSFSSQASHGTADLGLTWNMIDLGLGYYGSRQQADRVLIAAEKRRKAMHLLMQDVRTAYWRAAAAQKLRAEVSRTLAMAEKALADSRKVETERMRNPLDALRYQRQLLENLRLLEAIEQELSIAQVELATLINAPIGQAVPIAETQLNLADDSVLKLPLERLEQVALEHNADLREQHYNSRIAREEVRKTLARLFPNLSFNYGLKYDSDRYLVHNHWNEAGVQLSFNLFNLLTGPTQIKLAEAGVSLADQRRVATQMAVVTQVHLARLQLANARSQFARADAIYATDQKIAEQVRNRASVRAQSQLDQVANETTAILSLLRRYQALAQVHTAENRLMANLGIEPRIGSTGELSLAQLTEELKGSGNPWAALKQAAPQ
ncbi:TolC family protein [Malikia sp.]|uniref:TolC family protein n=1 Tax=Malikia sp. TaxID=2070706 RepID=UPI00261A56A8|nr:TolC family protein [Malikia sp.]MDD2727970.1 TolC family protein [Malikia sp.]